jgi:hypothetical protein
VDNDEKKQLMNLLTDIQSKLTSSTIMNGGFERLMEKVTKIETTQDKIIVDVNQLKEIIYDPDEGIYSKIKDCELSSNEKIHKLEKESYELKFENNYIKNNLSKVNDLDSNLNELNKIKENYSKFTWLVVAAVLSNIFWVVKNFVH